MALKKTKIVFVFRNFDLLNESAVVNDFEIVYEDKIINDHEIFNIH